jgi:hypothetical protein
MTHRTGAVALAAAALLVRPPAAGAHVISSDPVAGNYRALITGVTPPSPLVQLRVVDGDQRLWMQVRPGATVLVLGVQGEPFLRFAGGQVGVNTRSITARLDRLAPGTTATTFRPDAAPVWRRLAGGDAYLWPERRIGSLEPLAARLPPGRARWTIPLVVDGRRVMVSGELLRENPPGAWLWAVVVAAAIALAAVAVARRRPWMAAWVGTAGAAALVVARLGREAYGRPDLGLGNMVELALTLVVGLPLCYLLARGRRDARAFAGLVAGVLGIYQTLRFAPMLTHGLVFARIPGGIERTAVAVMAVAAPATLILAVFGEPEPRQADSRARTSSITSLDRNGDT